MSKNVKNDWWGQRSWKWLFILLVVAGVILWQQIHQDSWTYDERLHLQSLAEWLAQGRTPSDPFNPPLSKLLPLLPAAITARFTSTSINAVIVTYFQDPFLGVPRLTVVLTTLLTAVAVFVFVKYFLPKLIVGERNKHLALPALLASLLFIFEPLVLAHGHLFTTDMLATLFFFTSYSTFQLWGLYRDIWWWRLMVLSIALLAATKLVVLPMLATAMVISWWWRGRGFKELIRPKLLFDVPSWLGGIVLIWAAYRFSWLSPFVGWPFIPLGGFIQSILRAGCFIGCEKYEATRHLIYFGEVAQTGWWSYPLVAFFLKSSLPVIIIWLLLPMKQVRKFHWLVLPPILSVIGWVTLGRYSVGARHLLPIYPWLAVVGGVILSDWLKKRQRNYQLIAGFLICWHVVTVFTTTDFISYFQPLVSKSLGRQVLADSNVDWGQNLYGLAEELRADPSHNQTNPILLRSMSPFVQQEVYGLNAEQLPPVSELDLNDYSGRTIIIGATPWYTLDYYLHPQLRLLEPRWVGQGTMLLFEVP